MVAPLTRQYAELIANCRQRPLPDEAVEVATLGFTDAFGVMVAGAQEPAVRTLVQWVQGQGAAAQSRLIGEPRRMGMEQAALVNATAAHALDYDDFAFSNHPSAVLVPTILACADRVGARGSTMALAYAVGYEVWSDLMSREQDLYYDRGWHPTSVLGPLGAAAAAAVVLGFDAQRASHALALAASSASGVFENFGTMAKPYHGGRAASAGVAATSMAGAGLQASATALEGRHGLMRALSPHGNVDLDRPLSDSAWRIASQRLNIKKYPVVGAAQRAIDAVLGLDPAQAFAPDDVLRIVAHISARHAAVMPFHLPQDALQAKFSLQFALASALVHRAVGFAELQDSVVRSAPIQRLMALVELQTTDDFEPGWRDAAPFDQVLFHLRDGRSVASPQVRRATGHADTPLPAAQLRSKFMGCMAHGGVDAVVGAALFGVLQDLPQLESVSELVFP